MVQRTMHMESKFKLIVFSVYVLSLNVHNYLFTTITEYPAANQKGSDFSVVAAFAY